LREVLGVVLVAREAARDGEGGTLVAPHERLERPGIAGAERGEKLRVAQVAHPRRPPLARRRKRACSRVRNALYFRAHARLEVGGGESRRSAPAACDARRGRAGSPGADRGPRGGEQAADPGQRDATGGAAEGVREDARSQGRRAGPASRPAQDALGGGEGEGNAAEGRRGADRSRAPERTQPATRDGAGGDL